MLPIRREHVLYAGATLTGFVAVPLFYMFNVFHYMSLYRVELVFLMSASLVMGGFVSLWQDWSSGTESRLWPGVKIAVILLLLPVTAGTGIMVYDAYNAWEDHTAHWHADFNVIVDGEEHELISSEKFCDGAVLCGRDNRTGGTHFHEHDDMRIHRHGPILEREDAKLQVFFAGFDGKLAADELRYPTDDGWINVTEDEENTLKVLVKQGTGLERGWCAIDPSVDENDQCIVHDTGEPVTDPADYIISPYTYDPLDQIFFIYDDVPVDEALEDVRDDDQYQGIPVY